MSFGFTMHHIIGKIGEIAIYFDKEPFLTRGIQQALDTAKGDAPEKVEKINNIALTILSFEKMEDIMNACDVFFHGSTKDTLKGFFKNHPTCWEDLERKIHKHVKRDASGIYSINPDDQIHISRIFLIRDRAPDTGPAIRSAINSLFENQAFLRFCSKQPSLLDSSGYSLAQIPNDKKCDVFAKFLRQGLIQNITGCTENNVSETFSRVYRKIINWIPLVYGEEEGIYQEVQGCSTIDELAEKITRVIGDTKHSNYGRRRENAVRILQSFFAWGNIEEIEKLVDRAKKVIEPANIVQTLKQMKITIDVSKVTTKMEDDTIIYEYGFMKNNQKYTLKWRAKGLKSILQKLAENEDYTNADSIRDSIGITLIQEGDDESPNIETLKLAKGIKQAMPNYGYITTNRGFFSRIQVLSMFPKGGRQKIPLDQKNNSGSTTNPNLNNFSVSGYMNYEGNIGSLGTEVQILTRKAYDWKKNEDGYYKGKGLTELRMRGPKFDTLKGLYRAFDKRITSSGLEKIRVFLKKNSKQAFRINELIIQYIEDGWLIPYVVNGALVFTNKEKEVLMTQGFSNDTFYKIEKDTERKVDDQKEAGNNTSQNISYRELINYIRNFQQS